MDEIKVVINGAGAAAIAIGKLLLSAGVKDLTLCDRSGAVYEGRPKGMNPIKDEMARSPTSPRRREAWLICW